MRGKLRTLPATRLRGTRTRVTLSFDDAYASQYAAAALLTAVGLRGSFFVNSGLVGAGSDYLSWEQLERMAAAGHEIGGHTLMHRDLTQLSEAEIIREIGQDRLALHERGFEASSFAYPFGTHTRFLRQVVRRAGYSAGRAAWGLRRINDPTDGRPCVENVPPRDRFAIRTASSVGDISITDETIKEYIAAAERTGGWVTFVFHRIGAGESTQRVPFDLTFEGFAALVEWLARREAHGTLVQTVAEVLRRDRDLGRPFPRATWRVGVVRPLLPRPPSTREAE